MGSENMRFYCSPNVEINNYKKFIITEEEVKKENRDADRCVRAWEDFYEPNYSKLDFWKKTTFRNPKSYDYIEYVEPGIYCSISGDAFFNFKKGIKNRGSQKFEFFESLIKEQYSGKEREMYLNDLENCNKMFYSFHNFVLLPRTGSLNNFKGISKFMKNKGVNLDRADKFVMLLDKYYPEGDIDNIIFSKAIGRKSKLKTAEENRMIAKNNLKRFLDSLGTTQTLCKYLLLLNDEKYIKCLIENGKKEICNGKDVVNYMRLAIDFWNQRDKIINKNQ